MQMETSWSSPFREGTVKGKVAVVTGGASGIGLEISKQLGLHGARLALMGRRAHVLHDSVRALEALGIEVIGLAGDVRKKEDANQVVESTIKHFGRIDILVNGAAGNFLVPAEDLSTNGFRTVMDIDAVGTFTMCKAVLPYLKKGGPGKDPMEAGGVILNISATLHYTASWYQIHVSAAKAAVDSLTRSLALEWGVDYGIRVNGIAPGPIKDTPGIDKLAPKEMEEAYSDVHRYTIGEKWDIAMAVLYLASDAGKCINGAVIIVDGGVWLNKPRIVGKDVVRSISRNVELRSRQISNNIHSKL